MFSAGKQFRDAMSAEKPLQVMGVMNAFIAMMAKETGFRALYLSGGGVANFAHGLPDLAVTTLNDVLEEVRRIKSAVDLPLLVDIDTGWGNSLMIARTIRSMIAAGAAGVQIEDQVSDKRCGHRPGKQVVSIAEMIERLKAVVDARSDPNFVIVARADGTDLIERGIAYQNAGADIFFPEAVRSLEQYQEIKRALTIPVLANMTEFGQTPLCTVQELAKIGIDVILYPLTVARVMNHAAQSALQVIRQKGTQKPLLDSMQTREELYRILNYYKQEQKICLSTKD